MKKKYLTKPYRRLEDVNTQRDKIQYNNKTRIHESALEKGITSKMCKSNVDAKV